MEGEGFGGGGKPRLVARVGFQLPDKMPVAPKVFGRFRVLVWMWPKASGEYRMEDALQVALVFRESGVARLADGDLRKVVR